MLFLSEIDFLVYKFIAFFITSTIEEEITSVLPGLQSSVMRI